VPLPCGLACPFSPPGFSLGAVLLQGFLEGASENASPYAVFFTALVLLRF